MSAARFIAWCERHAERLRERAAETRAHAAEIRAQTACEHELRTRAVAFLQAKPGSGEALAIAISLVTGETVEVRATGVGAEATAEIPGWTARGDNAEHALRKLLSSVAQHWPGALRCARCMRPVIGDGCCSCGLRST